MCDCEPHPNQMNPVEKMTEDLRKYTARTVSLTHVNTKMSGNNYRGENELEPNCLPFQSYLWKGKEAIM